MLTRNITAHLLTVAGEVLLKSSDSKRILDPGSSLTLSPLLRHRTLESSRTELRFSIHSESTGPSSKAHFHPVGAQDGYGSPETDSSEGVFDDETGPPCFELLDTDEFDSCVRVCDGGIAGPPDSNDEVDDDDDDDDDDPTSSSD